MVKEQISYFNRIKKEKLFEVPNENMLKVKAIGDFDPQKLYRKEELETMLDFKKGAEICVIAAFTSDWLLGYKDQQNEVRIFPLMHVKILHDQLPKVIRPYSIKLWNSLGGPGDSPVKLPGNEKAFYQSVNLEQALSGVKACPKIIHQAIKDFVYEENARTLATGISVLNLRKGDLIAVTKLPNQNGWVEGVSLNKKEAKIGVFHVSFTTLISFKF